MSTQSSLAAKKTISQLYYITHIDNVPSILEKGIICHDTIIREGIRYTRIYDEEIVSNRKNRESPNGKSLWNFANVYFQATNPMLYRVTREKGVEKIAIIAVRRDILDLEGVFVSDGNAASYNSKIEPVSPSLLSVIADQIATIWWDAVDGKRKSMAECLVPEKIDPEYVQTVFVVNHDVKAEVDQKVGNSRVLVVPMPGLFFEPVRVGILTPNLRVIDGDMFFSRMQTLTISVNCVGRMGKGLASRAKYLFPDVYVYYDDLCRKHRLKLGKPFLYRRDIPLDHELVDEPSRYRGANSDTWFLLFPTKDHWRELADLPGIEKGLKWVVDNYRELSIKSLALPALGCGLGGLDWRRVGPIICKYMSKLNIPVSVYLPTEKKIPDQYIEKEFLLPE